MKKKVTRLALSRETLRTLSGSPLKEVAGGVSPNTCYFGCTQTCFNTCDTCYGTCYSCNPDAC